MSIELDNLINVHWCVKSQSTGLINDSVGVVGSYWLGSRRKVNLIKSGVVRRRRWRPMGDEIRTKIH